MAQKESQNPDSEQVMLTYLLHLTKKTAIGKKEQEDMEKVYMAILVVKLKKILVQLNQ